MTGGFELNADGTINRKLKQSTNLGYFLILNGKQAEFKPYVYLGIRYLEIENAPCEITQQNLCFISRYFELNPSRSSFVASIPILNQVWELMQHSIIVGTQEGFVDTPTREKGSFLSDGWSQAVPAMNTMGDRTMNNRVLNEFFDSQDQYWKDGRLNAVYPNADGGRDIPDFTQVFLIWVWDYYMQTGNKQFLTENYHRIRKVAEYVNASLNASTGLIHNLIGGGGAYKYGIIDWPPSMRYGYDANTESRTVIDVLAFADFAILSKIASEVGNKADAALYDQKAQSIKAAINAKLINQKGLYIDGLYTDLSQSSHVSQHANMLPLAMGIVPADNYQSVLDLVKTKEMNVGMVTVRWLCEALGVADQGAHLVELYTNPNWDGWAKTVSQGGTVTWESWNPREEDESMSHPWGAVGLLGIKEYIIGLKNLTPQSGRVQIKPLDFGDKLSSVQASLPTDKGNISIAWKRNATSYEMKIALPVNVTANVYLPKGKAKTNWVTMDEKSVMTKDAGSYVYIEHVGSGEHTFQRTEK